MQENTKKYGLMDVIHFLKCIKYAGKKSCLHPETVLGTCRQYVLKKVYEEARLFNT